LVARASGWVHEFSIIVTRVVELSSNHVDTVPEGEGILGPDGRLNKQSRDRDDCKILLSAYILHRRSGIRLSNRKPPWPLSSYLINSPA